MVLEHGVVTQVGAAPLPPLPDTDTIIGVAGTGTAGNPSSVLEMPHKVETLAEAQAAFGTSGTIIDAAEEFYAVNSGAFVGARYDHTGIGQNLIDTKNAALNALRSAEAVTGKKPTVVIGPGLGANALNAVDANAFATLLNTVAEAIKAMALTDVLDDTTLDAETLKAAAIAYMANNGGTRTLPLPFKVSTPGNPNLWASSFMAAQVARNDSINSVADSISNRILLNLVNVHPAYSFSYTDGGSQAQQLDRAGLTTIVRPRGIYRAFGGRFMRTDLYRYMGVLRITDAVNEDIQRAAEERIDRFLPESLGNWIDDCNDLVLARVGLRQLRSAAVFPDTVQNTRANLLNGRAYAKTELGHRIPAILLTNTTEAVFSL